MRCPREVTPHLGPIITVAIQYIKYDPNYSYGDDDDGEEDVDMDGEEYEEVRYGAIRTVCYRTLRYVTVGCVFVLLPAISVLTAFGC